VARYLWRDARDQRRGWVDGDLTRKQLAAYFGPDPDELERRGVHAVFLGYYFPWDPQASLEVARAHHFESDRGGPRTGYYDYADIDDDFISIPSLAEVVQIRLHASVRQSVARDS
jgi:hypothetical protein